MATLSAEFLGMMGLHQHRITQNTHHPQETSTQGGYGGLLVRSMTPSGSESSETSTDSPNRAGSTGSDRQSPALRPNMHRDPVHDPTPTKSENNLQIDEQNDSDDYDDSPDTSVNGSSTQEMTSANNDSSQDNCSSMDTMDTNDSQQALVIKPEPVFEQSVYNTPVNFRHSSYTPFDSASRSQLSSWSQNMNFESPALRKMPTEVTPTGQRSQSMKRNFSEEIIHGSVMAHPAGQQALMSPAMMMMAARMAGSEAMANMGGIGMIPHPWMLANHPVAMGYHGNADQQIASEGAPLDLSTMETPSKKLRRTPSPGRCNGDEPMNLSVPTSRSQEQKRSGLPGVATHQQQYRHLEDLVKRQLTQKEALKLQEVLYYEHMLLVAQLTARSEVEGHHGSFQRLHHIYMMEVDRIEKERYQAVMGNLSDQQRQATLTSFDQERLTLVLRIKQEISMLLGPSQASQARPTPLTCMPNNMMNMPNMANMPNMPQPMMYPMGLMYPWKHSNSPEEDNKDKIKKFLSPSAVKVLMEWYNQNEEHPYPEEDAVQHLATQAQVSPAQKYLEASEFLQNIVFISLPLTEEEKIQRFSTLSQLYGLVGMHRKSAFFKRVAAMQCVSPQNLGPSWLQCYQLLLQTLDGFKLSLDPKDIPHDQYFGWPLVQLRVLHELIYSARRMGNPAIAVRHLTLLFHVMFDHLSNNEKLEMASVLESYTVKCEGTPFALALDNGVILPPVPLTRIPIVRCLRLQSRAPHLRPVEFRSRDSHLEAHSSPFIYSPLVLSGSREKKDSSKMDFHWVEGEICDVALQVINPMPLELKVTNLCLMAEGAEFEAYPTTMSLPAESGPIPVKLHGMAKKAGDLNVLGYTICVFGVKSNCRLRILPHIKEDNYTVRVVGALPQLSLSTSLPKAISFSSLADSASAVTSANANIYAGQDCECSVTVTNIGKQPIEMIDITLDSKIQPDLLSKVFEWDSESLKSQLPLAVNGQATFTVHIHGTSDFLPTEQEGPGLSPVTRAKRWFATELADSDIEDDSEAVILEALLKVQYSGGPGLEDGFCRQCSIALITEIQPSIVFQKWQVLPHENPDLCFLVFDLENTSSNDIEVTYGDNTTAIEGKQLKRICMTFKRILMPEFADVPLEPRSKYMEGCQLTRHDMYSQHVSQFVDIRWNMTDTDNFGKLSTERLRWTVDQLKLIQTLPVSWEIFIEGSSCDGQTPVEVATGQSLTASCIICNKLEWSIMDAKLEFTCFCDVENGARQRHLEEVIVVMGQLQILSKNIPTNNKFSHEVTLVFLNPGKYTLDISCSGLKTNDQGHHRHVWNSTPSIQVIVSDSDS